MVEERKKRCQKSFSMDFNNSLVSNPEIRVTKIDVNPCNRWTTKAKKQETKPMKTTHIWLTVLTIALVLNAITLRTSVDGEECTAGIRKEHLDAIPGRFVDNTTIEIGPNGLQVIDGAVYGDVIADNAITAEKIDSIFGNWTNLDSASSALVADSVYQATSDGFVVAYGSLNTNGGAKPCECNADFSRRTGRS